MQIAILTTPITVGDYRELFPNTSFGTSGPNDEFLASNNAKKVTLFKAHDRLTQKLVSCTPYDDGEFVSMVQVESLTDDEIQVAKDYEMAQMRYRRNQFLKDCDWTQLDDTPMSNTQKADWAEYRQALRDVPDQAGFPWEVEWPVQPE
jgi:hypothetical protein